MGLPLVEWRGPLESRLLDFLQCPEEDGYGGIEGDNAIALEFVCEDVVQSLGRRLVLMFMIADILIYEMVVVVVGVMVVVTMGVISFSKKRCLTVTEVESFGVGFGLVGGDVWVWSVSGGDGGG